MAQDRGHFLTISNISHFFGANRALSDVSLAIDTGELIALVGPSGCGKTTLLKLIAGFLAPRTGDIWFEANRMNDVPANRRHIGMVFQNYALFPHMTVSQNIAYGLRARKLATPLIDAKVREMMAMVQLEAFAERYPAQLSGGQQQRVALARALAIDPQVILLDEPFSALDKNLRLDMQIEIKRLIKAYGVTTIMVTHDQEEALSMADRVVVMNAGRIEQTATPQRLYDNPASIFVNNFIGHTNLLRGRVSAPGTVKLMSGGEIGFGGAADMQAGTEVLVSIRPENLAPVETNEPGLIAAKVKMTLPLGASDIIETETSEREAIRLSMRRGKSGALPQTGADLHLKILDPSRASIFPRTTPSNSDKETIQ